MNTYLLGSTHNQRRTNTEQHAIDIGIPPETFIRCSSNKEAIEKAIKLQDGVVLVPYYNVLGASVKDTMIGIANSYPLLELIGTTRMQIQYWLVAKVGVSLKDIRSLGSHPQALYQTRTSKKKIFSESMLDYIDTGSTAGGIDYIHKNFQDEKINHYGGVIAPFQYNNLIDKDITVHSMDFGPQDNFTHFALMQHKGQGFQNQVKLSQLDTTMKFKKITLDDVAGSLLEELNKFYERGQSVYGITSISNVDDTTDFMIIYTETPQEIFNRYGMEKKQEWQLAHIAISDAGKHDYRATLCITPEHGSLRNAIGHFSRNHFDIREITSIPTGYGRIDFDIRFRALSHSNIENLEQLFRCSYMPE